MTETFDIVDGAISVIVTATVIYFIINILLMMKEDRKLMKEVTDLLLKRDKH